MASSGNVEALPGVAAGGIRGAGEAGMAPLRGRGSSRRGGGAFAGGRLGVNDASPAVAAADFLPPPPPPPPARPEGTVATAHR